MKRLYLLIFAVMLAFGFAACTGATTDATTQQTTNDLSTTVSTITTEDNSTETTTEFITTEQQIPVIEGVSNKILQMPNTIDLLEGITATDLQDGNITTSLVVTDNGGFNESVKGAYTITVSVTDSDDNTVTASFIVTVADNELTATNDLNSITVSLPLDLPKWSSNQTFYYWSSSNTKVITNGGFVINPPVGSDPVDVTLTCRAVNGPSAVTKDFVITVQPNSEVVITRSSQVDFDGTSTEYVVEDKTGINLFFEETGTVPYIDVEEFLYMVEGAIEPSMITFEQVGNDGLRLTYSVEYLDFDEVTIITESFEAYIDFTENTFTVNNYDFFGSYLASTESDYGSGLLYTGADYLDGEQVTIPLGDYNCDIVVYNDGVETYYLMPFHIANLLFLGDVYYDAYYNGDMIYGVSLLLTPDEEEAALHNQIRTSSLNSASMADDMRLASYNYMALVIDYFYGLKEDKNIESAYDIMIAYAESMLSGNDLDLYSKIFKIAYGLDDLHTSHTFPGYYETPYGIGLSIRDVGPQTKAFYDGLWAVEEKLELKYGSTDDVPEFELLENDTICVINITGFTIDTPDEFKAILDNLPATVVDVVINLNYNTGGNLGAVLRIYGYMTEEPFMYHSQNPADNSAATYYIESEYVAYDYNWYVVTSSVTFSAANLFASMAKEQGIPVIGQDSSGGASSIGCIITPDGSAIIISTNNVLSARVGDETNGYDYLSIENGIAVDYKMTDVTSDSQLITIINQIKDAQAE